jgi:hypothetical protein
MCGRVPPTRTIHPTIVSVGRHRHTVIRRSQSRLCGSLGPLSVPVKGWARRNDIRYGMSLRDSSHFLSGHYQATNTSAIEIARTPEYGAFCRNWLYIFPCPYGMRSAPQHCAERRCRAAGNPSCLAPTETVRQSRHSSAPSQGRAKPILSRRFSDCYWDASI